MAKAKPTPPPQDDLLKPATPEDVLLSLTVMRPSPTISTEAKATQTKFAAVSITTPEQYEASANDLLWVKRKYKEIDDARTTLKKPVADAVKTIDALFKEPLEWLAAAEKSLKAGMTGYITEQNRIAEEKRKEAAEQERKNREEAEKREQEAAAARKKAEQDEAAAKASGDREAQVAAQMEKLRATRAEQTAQVAAQVAATPVVVHHQQPMRVAGVVPVKRWSFRIVDQAKINASFKIPDEVAIRKIVTSLKDAEKVKKIVGEGIEVFQEDDINAARK